MRHQILGNWGLARPLGTELPLHLIPVNFGLAAGAPVMAAQAGAAPAAPISNVKLRFMFFASQFMLAANQHVYLDVEPGTMTHLRTDAQGTIVEAAGGGGAVTLDSSREYSVISSANEMNPIPLSSEAKTTRIRNGLVTVFPHVTIWVADETGSPIGDLDCTLEIGSETINVTSVPGEWDWANAPPDGGLMGGWIWSNVRSEGAVILRSNTKLIKMSGDSDPNAEMRIVPTSVKRGSSATISIAPTSSSAIRFKVTEWKYDISHTNPGFADASEVTVTRPANENASRFDQSWAGILCASGTATAKFVTGVSLRSSGSDDVYATVVAAEPIEKTLEVTVAPRTGNAWVMTPTLQPEGVLNRAISGFRDLGQHTWSVSNGTPGLAISATVATGPNRGCRFVSSALSGTFTSTPKINSRLTNAASTFSQAQGQARLISPTPIRVIPPSMITVGNGGAFTIDDEDDFRAHFGIGNGTFRTSDQGISHAALLAGTRRHEFVHATHSHRANCVKALRALDPNRFAEALVRIPGATLNLTNLVRGRINLIAADNVSVTHDLVDESGTRDENSVQHTGGDMLGVNQDSNGDLIGSVWNPTTDRILT